MARLAPALFSALALLLASRAALGAWALGRVEVSRDAERGRAGSVRLILFCGALCLIAARLAR